MYRLFVSHGDWDTNLRINDGRFDLAVRDGEGGYELVLEVKVLGGGYQTKVLTGSAGTLNWFAASLTKRRWVVDPKKVAGLSGFSLLSDYRRLRALKRVRNKILVLVVDNRTDGDTVPGKALANIEFTSQMSKHLVNVVEGLHARVWHI